MRLLAALKRVGITATLVGLAAALLALGAPSVSTAQPVCTISWDGGATGAWHEAANWTGDALPGPADHVCIPTSVTVEVSQDVGSVLTVQSQGTLAISGGSLSLTDTLTLEGSTTTNLILSGGSLGGTGNLTVTGSFQWTAGVQTGTGTTTVASGATLTIDTDGVKFLETRTLANNGLVNWSAGAIRTRSAAAIENAGTFDVQFDGLLFNDFGAQSRFHNTGTLRKSAGSGTASIGIPLDSDGTVEVARGILSAASYTQSASGTLHLHVGGLTPGTGFTQLDVTGAATLDGTLRITTESGFTPALGQSFRILNANPRTGTFSSIQGTDAGGGLAYTIQYDDTGATLIVGPSPSPHVSIGDVSVSEGDSGERSANFVVTLSRAAAQDVTVDFSTADGSASAPADYTARSGQLTIAAGQTTGQIAVAVQGDTLDEPDETFLVNLTNAVNATISDAQATGTISDDDAPGAVPGCEVSGKGVIKAANGDWATFRFDVESGARPRGRARYRDRGPARPLRLKSSQITAVALRADERHATILGTGKINRAGSYDFAIEVDEVPHAPDTFHIRLNGRYDSGKQRILKGDVDIECEEDDDDRHDKGKKS